MNVMELMVKKAGIELNGATGRTESEKLDKVCNKYYSRFLAAYNSQYIIGTPPPMLTFLALDANWIKALDFEPGSLVRHVGDGRYYIVDAWKMGGLCARVDVHDGNGVKKNFGYADFEPADIPSEIIGIAIDKLKKKCPLMCGEEGDEDEG